MTIEPIEPDDGIQVVWCVGCERPSLISDCVTQDAPRIQCPRCGTRMGREMITFYSTNDE